MSTTPPESATEIERLEAEIAERREAIASLRRAEAAMDVADDTLEGPEGPVKLSALFGDRDELVVIHNMGRRCAYCTMWADGFNGLAAHIEDRTAFVVVSKDAPDVQQAFAAERGWGFRMVSSQGTTFARDLGFEQADGSVWPGASVLVKRPDGSIARVDKVIFGPGDDYNAAWHLFALLPGGAGDWGPRLRYALS